MEDQGFAMFPKNYDPMSDIGDIFMECLINFKNLS